MSNFNKEYTYEECLSMDELEICKIFYKVYRKKHYINDCSRTLSEEGSMEMLYHPIIMDIWKEITRQDEYHYGHNNVSTNSVLGLLLKNGITRKDITYKNGVFHIKTANGIWSCYGKGSDFWIQPVHNYNQSAYWRYTMNEASPEILAEVFLWFDRKVIPLLRKNLYRLERICKVHAFDMQKKEMEKRIVEDTLNGLAETTLKPKDVAYSFSYEDDLVVCSFDRCHKGKFILNLEEAEQLLQDPAKMLKGMTRVNYDDCSLFTYQRDFWKWTIIPEKEPAHMKRLRELTYQYLAPHQIYVVAYCRDMKVIIEAMQVHHSRMIELPFQDALNLVSDYSKVEALMSEKIDSRNFLNLDRSSIFYSI